MPKTKRQKQEKKIWDDHIQPLINEYRLTHLKYKCMDWDPKWMDTKEKNCRADIWSSGLRLVHGHQSFDPSFMRNDETYHHGTLDLIAWLTEAAHEEKKLPYFERSDGTIDYPKISPEDVLPIFKTHMRLHFEHGTLPYLLEQIALQYKSTTKFFIDEERTKQKECQWCGEYFTPSKLDPRIKYCQTCSPKSKMTLEQRRDYMKKYRENEKEIIAAELKKAQMKRSLNDGHTKEEAEKLWEKFKAEHQLSEKLLEEYEENENM